MSRRAATIAPTTPAVTIPNWYLRWRETAPGSLTYERLGSPDRSQPSCQKATTMRFLPGEESSLRRPVEGSKVRRQSVESGIIVGGISRHLRVLRHALRILHVGRKLLRSLPCHRT